MRLWDTTVHAAFLNAASRFVISGKTEFTQNHKGFLPSDESTRMDFLFYTFGFDSLVESHSARQFVSREISGLIDGIDCK